MATLSRKDNGWLIQFYDEHKRRRPIYLGKRYSEKTAKELKGIVETLIRYRDNGEGLPDKKTQAWIDSACPEIREKLAAVGLIEKPSTHTVEELWSACLAAKQDIKESTQETYFHARRRFFEFFKPQTVLTTLEPAHFQRWKENLRKTLEASTVAGTIVKTKAVFNWAVRSGWLEKSPLEGVGHGSFVNPRNDQFVTMDEYRRLLDACPCQDWRAIIALARIGGLRAPSEVLRLRWSDVNWDQGRFYVQSPKTERHEGMEGRLVPLFPELRKVLEQHRRADSRLEMEYVINRYRDPERTNLGTQFARIVKMAGLKPIKRPFDNLRASRSNEVYSEFGAFLESKWIGHSAKTARQHYLQVMDADFKRATEEREAGESESGANGDSLQNPPNSLQ